MIDHRLVEQPLRPLNRVRVGALTSEKQGPEFGEIISRKQLALRILLFDGAEGCWRGEKGYGIVLGNDAPERARIRGADRLALVHDRGRPVQGRPVDAGAVPNYPAEGGPAP